MKKILVLGAGSVAGPLIDYFLDREGFQVEVADLVPSRAERLVAGRARGMAVGLDIKDDNRLASLIARNDLAVSFVPSIHHPRVARHCLAASRHLLTASYVSPEMNALDEPAKAKKLIFLNEVGLDPGLDHMEAMRIIDRIRESGGRVLSFLSYCGGLPAPEANTNPFGYKFSWSPAGVLMASRNAARYLRQGREVFVPAEELFDQPAEVLIDDLGVFEGYPNRDSLAYLSAYGLQDAETVLRGTLRYPGWCRTLKLMKDLGFLDDSPGSASWRTCRDFASERLGVSAGVNPVEHLKRSFTQAGDREALQRLEWLGVFDDLPLPPGPPQSVLEVMAGLMAEKMSYEPGERDMIVLQHRITARFPDGRYETIQSTLVQFGIPDGESAMARTVALPAAICVRLILQGEVGDRGVLIPTSSGIYRPVLQELKKDGIQFEEKRNVGSRPS